MRPMAAKVKLGVIGSGVIGSMHLKNALTIDGVEVEAVADLIEANRKRAAEEFAPKKVYTDANELINDPDVDAVVLAFPTTGRYKFAVKAFQAGKHVLVEKPAGMNAGEVETMIEAQGDLIGGCCSARYSLTAAARGAARFVAEGNLGRIRSVHCRAFSAAGKRPEKPGPVWRLRKELNGGGILVNWGVYDLDFLMTVTGWKLEPKTVLASAWPVPARFADYVAPGSDAETHVSAHIQCAGGETIRYERGEFMALAAESSWQIIGERGSLRLDMVDTDTKELLFDRADPINGVESEVLYQGDSEPVDVHRAVLRDFVEAVAERRQPCTDLPKALTMQRLVDAIYRSAESGSPEEM